MPEFFRSTAKKPGVTKVRKGYKKGGGDWIQKAFSKIKKKGTEGKCTGKKYGSKSCPPGSKAYNMAKTLRSMNRKKAAKGGRIGLANGGLSHAAGYKPVLGNNRFG